MERMFRRGRFYTGCFRVVFWDSVYFCSFCTRQDYYNCIVSSIVPLGPCPAVDYNRLTRPISIISWWQIIICNNLLVCISYDTTVSLCANISYQCSKILPIYLGVAISQTNVLSYNKHRYDKPNNWIALVFANQPLN